MAATAAQVLASLGWMSGRSMKQPPAPSPGSSLGHPPLGTTCHGDYPRSGRGDLGGQEHPPCLEAGQPRKVRIGLLSPVCPVRENTHGTWTLATGLPAWTSRCGHWGPLPLTTGMACAPHPLLRPSRRRDPPGEPGCVCTKGLVSHAEPSPACTADTQRSELNLTLWDPGAPSDSLAALGSVRPVKDD